MEDNLHADSGAGSVLDRLHNLAKDSESYRSVLLTIFRRKLSRPQDCRRYFSSVWVCLSRLYLDYAIMMRDMPKMSELANRQGHNSAGVDVHGEAKLRSRLRARLSNIPCWSSFEADLTFSPLKGMISVADYVNCFTVHLPEIFYQALSLEQKVRIFEATRDRRALSDLKVGLVHMGRRHISFVLAAARDASDESCWK